MEVVVAGCEDVVVVGAVVVLGAGEAATVVAVSLAVFASGQRSQIPRARLATTRPATMIRVI